MKPVIYVCFTFCLSISPQLWCAPSITDRYIALAIQGDLRDAPALIEQAARRDDPVAAEWAPRFRERFLVNSESRSPHSGDPLLDAVTGAYRAYWADGLMNRSSAARREALLYNALGAADGANPGRQELEQRLQAVLGSRGIHAIFTPAPPLQDFFAWREEARERYPVELTDGRREVEVVFMNDFVSLGWKDYASLGLATTTGWVEDGVLWCVEWAYVKDSETFEVSYLKHEARHLADLERFPALPSSELEYRAKLTELAYANTTLYRVLDDFSAKSAANPSSPHAEANLRVTRDLEGQLFGARPGAGLPDWRLASVPRINRAARELLDADTQRLLEVTPRRAGR